MQYSCLIKRLLIAAALGYVGAGPADNVALSWIIAVSAVVATYLWATWWRRDGSACAVPHERSTKTYPRRADGDHVNNEQELYL